MKKILSENPLVILVDQNYDCTFALNQPIVQSALENCRSEKRRNEIIYTRSIIYQELKINELLKDEVGRPTLPEGDVSISHSGELYGVCFHPKKHVGIDIEIISDKPGRIKEKFRNENELIFDESDEEITRLWTLKEAVYKYLARPGVLFAEQIHIQKIKPELYQANYIVDGEIKERLKLKSIKHRNYLISFTL